ncbi:MAG: TolC family protein [Bacteroidetes bacterium]|nr:TolC family protein [Bacteroidota bacterium]
MNKRFSKRKLIAIVTLMLLSTYMEAQQIHALSIQEAIAYAKKNNVQVKNALIDLQIQQQTNKAVTAGALPSVSATGTTTAFIQTPVTLVPGEFFGGAPGTTKAVNFQPKYSAGAAINLKQVLFDGTVFVGLKARKTSLDYYQKAIDVTDENVRANIYKVYYQLVVSRKQMEQLDANITRAEKLLSDAKAMYQNGFQEELDVDRATVQLANLQTQKLSTQSNIDNGYFGLKFLMGMPIKDSLVLTEDFSEDNLKKGVLNDTAYKYEDRNDYQYLLLTKKLGDYNVQRYKSSYWPTLDLNGSFQKNALANEYNFFQRVGTWYPTSYVGLTLNVPIFSGFEKNANLRKSRLQLQQVENQIENMKISIDNDVSQAQNKFRAAIITIDNQKKNMVLAESVYNQTKKKYELGLASNTDITNAQTDLIAAQTNYINALYDGVIARVDYFKAIGKLP